MCKKKSMYLQTRGSFKSAKKRLSLHITNPQKKSTDHEKRLGPQIAKPRSATFGEDPLTKKSYIRTFADLLFAEHICEPPTFGYFITNEISTGSFIGSSSFTLILIGPQLVLLCMAISDALRFFHLWSSEQHVLIMLPLVQPFFMRFLIDARFVRLL
jgi:hypothetical protein